MNKFKRQKQLLISFFLLLIIFSFTIVKAADNKSNISIEQLRVILPPSVATSTSAYGVIKNTSDEADTLIKMSTNAGMIMLHKTEIKDGIAEMKHVHNYVLKSGEKLVLKPMSYHLMLMNIDHDIIKKDGEVLMVLEFKKAGKLKIKVPILTE